MGVKTNSCDAGLLDPRLLLWLTLVINLSKSLICNAKLLLLSHEGLASHYLNHNTMSGSLHYKNGFLTHITGQWEGHWYPQNHLGNQAPSFLGLHVLRGLWNPLDGACWAVCGSRQGVPLTTSHIPLERPLTWPHKLGLFTVRAKCMFKQTALMIWL